MVLIAIFNGTEVIHFGIRVLSQSCVQIEVIATAFQNTMHGNRVLKDSDRMVLVVTFIAQEGGEYLASFVWDVWCQRRSVVQIQPHDCSNRSDHKHCNQDTYGLSTNQTVHLPVV